MSKQKVSQLPQEEKAALIKEANELGIFGIFDNYNVETLQNKISEKKKEKEQADDEENKNQDSENNPEENVQKVNEEAEKENNEENQSNKESKEAKTNDEQIDTIDKQCDGKTDSLSQNEVKEAQVYKICHICRSKVINGKCTGCGFEGK